MVCYSAHPERPLKGLMSLWDLLLNFMEGGGGGGGSEEKYGGPKVQFLFSAPFVLFSAQCVLFSAPFVLFSAQMVQRRESVLWGHRRKGHLQVSTPI